jgi:hypothetical protein
MCLLLLSVFFHELEAPVTVFVGTTGIFVLLIVMNF